ncbi:hypothetical protein [Ralstonia holmesii]|uniref:Transmembrane protein n=1 Tax=Ralstonia holmesii TaxID=3058602 RepID=A0ABC8QDS2_9RALS|nr:hypothetical protein [Ralstonia sp. LMG 32967]CAJ0793004.1 hypothetical protein LMG18096_02764 [Ralstonia sp. LMG 32967]CAJ0819475.1 hypothetical protein LMG18093_04045 [Ralstonia sp. LMG 32967]
MSLHWQVQQPPDRERGKPPSLWIAFAIFVVVQLVGTAITVMTWGAKPVASVDFFVRLLVLPLSATAVLCAALYKGYENRISETDWWNYLCRSLQSRWRSWAQRYVVIVACATVTPEAAVAERMLGLEGPKPDNAGERLPLDGQNQEFNESRLEGVLRRLLVPLSETVTAIAPPHTLHVCLQSTAQEGLAELRQVWEQLHLPEFATFSWQSLEASLSPAEPWLANGQRELADFQLTLACQLHQPGEEPVWSEVAVALQTTTPTGLAAHKNKFKPLAYLFRPITTESDQVVETMHTLLRAQQVLPDCIKQLWVSGLAGQSWHITQSAVRDCGLELPARNLDEAIGKPGPVSSLLLHALAAQMVRHGQGVQLAVTSVPSGVQLGLVGTQLAPIASVDPTYYPMFSLCTTIQLLGIACLVLFGVQTLGGIPDWLPSVVLAFVILMIPLQIGASILLRRETTNDFHAHL